jgi:hypothetical protein
MAAAVYTAVLGGRLWPFAVLPFCKSHVTSSSLRVRHQPVSIRSLAEGVQQAGRLSFSIHSFPSAARDSDIASEREAQALGRSTLAAAAREGWSLERVGSARA